MFHPFTLAFAQVFAAMHYIESRSFDSALYHTETLIELAQDQGFIFWLAGAGLSQAVCLVHMGWTPEGIEGLTQELATIERMGVAHLRPAILILPLSQPATGGGRLDGDQQSVFAFDPVTHRSKPIAGKIFRYKNRDGQRGNTESD